MQQQVAWTRSCGRWQHGPARSLCVVQPRPTDAWHCPCGPRESAPASGCTARPSRRRPEARRRVRPQASASSPAETPSAEPTQQTGPPLPTSLTAVVLSASSNMVRVELDKVQGSGSGSADTSSTQQETHNASQPDLPRTELLCSLRTLLKKMNQTVLVGDRVVVTSVDWNLGRGQVESVLPRQSELTDPAVANVDFALLLFALTNPAFEESQVSRFLVSMEASEIPFRIVLNKADLVSTEELQRRTDQVRSWGYEPLVVSCEGEGQGLGQVMTVLENKTAVVAGPSGAGKSSLINAIRLGRHRVDDEQRLDERFYGGPIRLPSSVTAQVTQPSPAKVTQLPTTEGDPTYLAVGDLSRSGRGRHTTTTTSLIRLPGGGRLADTPGFGLPSLEGIRSTELQYHFPEFTEVTEREGGCQFSNCLHMHEPGCAINSHEPPLERHLIYIKFLLEIKELEEKDSRVLQAGKKAREGNAKVKMAGGGRVRQEAKLDTKHRRQSRTKLKQATLNRWDD